VAAARRLGPLIRDRRDESERDRRLPAIVLSAMHEARLFRMYVPVEYGGLETDPITSMQVVEAVAEADAAMAWNLMIGATYGIWAAFCRRQARAKSTVPTMRLLPAPCALAVLPTPSLVGTGSAVAGRLPAGSITAPGGMVAALSTKMEHLALPTRVCRKPCWSSSPPPTASGSTPGTPVGCAVRVATIMQSAISSFLRRDLWRDASPRVPGLLYRLPCQALLDSAMATFHSASPELRSIL
jgi:hypothetical protein